MSDTDDFLYICTQCSTITFEPVFTCPACGRSSEPRSLGFEIDLGEGSP
jgi:rubrerythrin